MKAARHDIQVSGARSHALRRDAFIAAFATLYTMVLLFAGGAKFLMMSALLYAPGTVLFMVARRERSLPVFLRAEWIIFAAAVCGALAALIGLITGTILI
jgi:arginine:ornithine antiporter/lysine permease